MAKVEPIAKSARRRRRMRIKKFFEALPFITPSMLGFLVFIVLPVVSVFILSFYDWDFLSSPSFIGISNYTEIVKDPRFWISLQNTLIYTAIFVPLSIFLALILAVALNTRFLSSNIFKTIYFLPAVFSLVAVSIIWRFIFDSNFGILNYILSLLHLPRVHWLTDPKTALLSIILVGLWKNLGYNMVIYLAGLQRIPPHLYEAARIDGAGKLRQFTSITVPLLRPSTFFILVTSVINSFQVFDQVYVMTGGGPGSATRVYVFHLYQVAFQFFQMGKASALAFVLFILIFLFTLAQMKLLDNSKYNQIY